MQQVVTCYSNFAIVSSIHLDENFLILVALCHENVCCAVLKKIIKTREQYTSNTLG